MNAEPFQDDAFPHDEPDEDSVVSRHPGQSAFYLVVSGRTPTQPAKGAIAPLAQ
jgi:hypothetical protein